MCGQNVLNYWMTWEYTGTCAINTAELKLAIGSCPEADQSNLHYHNPYSYVRSFQKHSTSTQNSHLTEVTSDNVSEIWEIKKINEFELISGCKWSCRERWPGESSVTSARRRSLQCHQRWLEKYDWLRGSSGSEEIS
jgi:hypothetical protein